MYLIRGLIKSILIILAIITAGIVAAIFMNIDLNSRMATAQESGIDEGRHRGYQVGFHDGSRGGYQEGSKVGYATSWQEDTISQQGSFYFVYNPTYAEVQEILREKDGASAWEIHDYAEALGMRTAYVRAQIVRKAAEGKVWVYRLVAFDTLDQGFIIIEPWSHEVVKIEVGKGFRELNGFPSAPYDDTISKVTVIW